MTAEEFKTNREKLNLSRKQFADKLGIGEDAVISKELKRRKVTKRDERMIEKLLLVAQLS